MSYQVLARKYRPQRFADVAGQEHATVTLMHAIEQERVAHGYIFSGHRGIGKTTVARILGMALNCRNSVGSEIRPSVEPCGQCESCTEIRAGNSVDVIEIDAATNRGIDEIRELRDAARYRPARDRYKIYILDEAHQITDAAFNALLKTLEEPPEHIVFMMATTQPEDIPQTVRSRCQHFGFRAVKLAQIQDELRSVAERESIEASESALNVLAEAGDGSMRDALSVMDQAIASAPLNDGRPRLDAVLIREMLGTVSNAVFERMLEAINDGRTADLLVTANDLMDAGNSPAQLARQFVRYLRNTLLAKIAKLSIDSEVVSGTELLQISTDEQRRAVRSATLFSEEELTRFLQITLRTFDDVGFRQEPRLHLELGLLKLGQIRRLLPLEELLSQLPSASGSVSVPSTTVRPSATQDAPFRMSASSPIGGLLPSVSANSPEGTARVLDVDADRSRLLQEQQRNAQEERSSRPGQHDSARPKLSQSSTLRTEGEANRTRPMQVHLSATAAHTSISIPDPTTTQAAGPLPTAGLEAMRVSILNALREGAAQTSAADALAEGDWVLEGGVLRVHTVLSKSLVALLLNAEANLIIKKALAAHAFADLRFEVVSATPKRAASAASSRGSLRPGSVEARAQQHPIVREAQRLFNAEIRNVIDLSSK